MKKLKQQNNKAPKKRGLFLSIAVGSLCAAGMVNASDTPVNQTKINMTSVIADACSQDSQINQIDFQTRCNAFIGAAGSPAALPLSFSDTSSVDNIDGVSQLTNGINQVAPEQQIVSGVQATRTMKSVLSIANVAVLSRLDVMRAQMHHPDASRYADKSQYDSGRFAFALRPTPTGGAAGIADSSRLGIWGNGTYTTGDVDTSANQQGFDFDNWGGTLGVDYRITNNLVAGAAFSYLNTDADVDNSGSTVESDSYTGSIFGMYSHDSGFYVDAIASYGAAEFDISRSISYIVGTDVVNATAEGDPDGSQYSFGAGIGYQYSIGATSIEPFARATYQELEIDSFSESESGAGVGWGSRFAQQRVRSLPTTVGLRLSHAFSTSWGVFQPQVHGAWYHEFKDDQRTIKTSFLGNGGNRTYNIVTEGPDRDYYTVGASLSATLPHGITAFAGYSTMLGYRDVNSHQVTFGGRLEF
jgi:outer membrane autotransporter protein